MSEYFTLMQMSVATRINAVIDSLSSVPVLKKIIPPSLIGNFRAKKSISFLGLLLSLLFAVFCSSMGCLLIAFWIPQLISPEALLTQEVFVGIYLVFFVLGAPFNAVKFFRMDRHDFMCLKHFMLNPRTYYCCKTLQFCIIYGLFLLPLFLLLLKDFLFSTSLVLARIGAILLGNMFLFRFYHRHHRLPGKKLLAACKWSFLGLTYAAIYCGYFTGVKPSAAIPLTVVSPPVIIAGVFSHKRFQDYKSISVLSGSYKDFQIAAEPGLMKEESARKNQFYFEKHKDLSPAGYIDAAFLHRCGNSFQKYVRNQALFLMILFPALGLAVKFGVLSVGAENLQNYFPLLICSVSCITLANNMAPEYYRYVDRYMAANHLFTKDYLKGCILKRCQYTTFWDLTLMGAFAAAFGLFLAISDISLTGTTFFLIVMNSLLMLLFLETCHWCIYYLLEPYDKSQQVRNPLFAVLHMAEALGIFLLLLILKHLFLSLWVLAGLLVFTLLVLWNCFRYPSSMFRPKDEVFIK